MINQRIGTYAPAMLSLLRTIAGLLFLAHGTQKFLGFPAGEGAYTGLAFAHPAAYAGVIELLAGLLIALGLFTRSAAFLASGTMAFAYFIGHATQSFWPVNNGGDAAILYSFTFLLFVFAGPGPISLDAHRGQTGIPPAGQVTNQPGKTRSKAKFGPGMEA